MSVNLHIKTVGANSNEISVDIDTSATVAELKEQIAERVGLPASHIRLVCAGRIWQDATSIASYEPKAGAMVHCLNNPPRATPAAEQQVVSEANPMQTMMQGVSPMTPTSDDPFEQMMAQSQRMLMQNPEMMQQMMSSPMVQQMMSNPDTIRSMMQMNPRLNQLMEQRPEIARMLEDPEILQQSMRMATNPSLMREMQRNADLSIGRLDAMPGGHNALVRAHEDISDPLFAAMSGNGEGGAAQINTYSHSTEGGPNSEALPNPWGAPASTASPSPATPAVTPSAGLPTGAGQAANPFLASALAPAGQPGAPTGAPAGGNPMAAMMQQMMSNPEMMQQSMAMAQQMFGQGAPGAAAGTTPAAETPGAEATPPMNPFAAMLGGQAAATPQTGANPFAAMMQQMMNNPAMMQQSAALAQPMFGQGLGAPATATATSPSTEGATAQAAPPVNPLASMFGGQAAATPQMQANPMAAFRQQMMQQMLSNPAMMQQSTAMAQQMLGQGAGAAPAPTAEQAPAAQAVPPVNPFAAMFGNQAAPQPGTNPMAAMMQQMLNNPTPTPQATTPAATNFQRAQFAAQLAQLSAMGFANEEACLRALTQHQGRVDAAIDALLSSGEGAA